MRVSILSSLLLLLLATSAPAEAVSESWEGGHGPLAVVGTGNPLTIAKPRAGFSIDHFHGNQYPRLINNSPTEVPQAYVAWIKNLAPNDIVVVCPWGGMAALRMRAYLGSGDFGTTMPSILKPTRAMPEGTRTLGQDRDGKKSAGHGMLVRVGTLGLLSSYSLIWLKVIAPGLRG